MIEPAQMVEHVQLPIGKIKEELMESVRSKPVVLTAPTGSGKSTEVPRWCAKTGRVLVIEPRRVACRGLAARVSDLEGTVLGDRVGYAVRDDGRYQDSTQIVYATPGVVIRIIASKQLHQFDVVILDEFHERSLEVDLLLALLKERFKGQLIITSATIDAGRLCNFMDAIHHHAPGRTYDVKIRNIPGQDVLPSIRGLDDRIKQALDKASSESGDILIFLPGKAEIGEVFSQLSFNKDLDVQRIHGGLSLKEQSQVFEPSNRRKVILSTNVAETSLTIPGIRVVIDSGLVRRTRYFNGRGYLTLVPIATDSADQRAGRAGRTSEGICYRLWSDKAILEKQTPPEIYRESLSPLLMSAAFCDSDVTELRFLDPPKDYAVEAALSDLQAIGALNSKRTITSRGRQLYGLSLDAPLANFLVESEKLGCLEDAIDLVSVICIGRSLFTTDSRPVDPEEDLRSTGCDMVAAIKALRWGKPSQHRVNGHVINEARVVQRRLRTAYGLPLEGKYDSRTIDRTNLILAALRSDRRCAFVSRVRRGNIFFSNGGKEIQLSKQSAVEQNDAKAIVVLMSMAVGLGYRDSKIIATCASPIGLSILAKEGFGELQIQNAQVENDGTVVASMEQVYCGCVIQRIQEVPVGVLARKAVKLLFMRGSIFLSALAKTKNNLEQASLLKQIKISGLADEMIDLGVWAQRDVPTIEQWVDNQLCELGVESGSDLTLLSETDLVAPPLPDWSREWLDKHFCRQVNLGDAVYSVLYDFRKREVTLEKISGARKTPPSLNTVPLFRGFRIRVRHHSKVWVLRESP